MQALTARFGSLEPLAQARVLLSGCFMRPDRLESCREGLKGLAQAARLDDDEWVCAQNLCELISAIWFFCDVCDVTPRREGMDHWPCWHAGASDWASCWGLQRNAGSGRCHSRV